MLLVLDTNVLVSGLLNPAGAPGRIVDLLLAGCLRLAYDDRMLAKYRGVLLRPRFGFPPQAVEHLIDYITYTGEAVLAPPLDVDAPAPTTDLPFAEVALAAAACCVVTGNKAHFGFLQAPPVLSPAEFLRRWTRSSPG